jgi:molecular chaperone GrpE
MSDDTQADTPEETLSAEQQIEQLEAKNAELLNNWKRTAADFENYKKKRPQEDRELLDYAKNRLVYDLLPSLQSLEQVLKYAPADEKYKDWLQGLKATISQLEKTMEGMGVAKINTVGQKFDHNLHEAVEETADAEPDVVAKEIQPGFTLNGNVIIPAKVVVGKKAIN